MFETTVAGSLPKPICSPNRKNSWPAWRLEGDALAAGKIDATILPTQRVDPKDRSGSILTRRLLSGNGRYLRIPAGWCRLISLKNPLLRRPQCV
jgi:hypothetical protein